MHAAAMEMTSRYLCTASICVCLYLRMWKLQRRAPLCNNLSGDHGSKTAAFKISEEVDDAERCRHGLSEHNGQKTKKRDILCNTLHCIALYSL